jgi:hypothetical protein
MNKRQSNLLRTLLHVGMLWALLSSASVTVLKGQASQTNQGNHHQIVTADGGKISYGEIEGATTEAAAMGAVLHSLHMQTQDRPKVGKLFQIKGSESVGVFVGVSKAKIGGGEIAGLLIATKVSDDHVEAAFISDDAAKFPKTLAPMMKTLNGVWHPFAGSPSAGKSGAAARPTSGQASSAPAAPLHPFVLRDRSASVSLPDGWQVAQQFSGGGTIVASGPGGDAAELGVGFLASDTNNPAVQHTLQQLRMGQLRGTSYASGDYVPYNGDLTKIYIYLMQNMRKKANLSQANYNFTTSTAVGNGPIRCQRMAGTVDMQDGKGNREINVVFCVKPPGPYGQFLASAYSTTALVATASQSRATLDAIMRSFREDPAVISREASEIAKPAVDAINAYGAAVVKRAQDSEKAFEIRNSSVYKQWDSNDRRSQEFSNATLGYSVIQDNAYNGHGTFYDDDAAALVKSDPNRFEYVNAPNYWKDIDY